jgi:3-hydroxybutyryl-CoA dehydratase
MPDASRPSITVGAFAELMRLVTNDDVRRYADLVGDHNPIHLDEAFAATTPFKARIAHGMFAAGLISAVMATKLPGPGTIYLSQTLRFTRPVYLGDELRVRVEVVEVAEKRRVRMATTIHNQRGEAVLDGEALLSVPREALADG